MTRTRCAEVRAVELAVRVARGEQGRRSEVDWLIETARTIGAADIIAFALAAAAAALAARAPERTRALLAELEQVEGAHETPYYARQLAAMLRTALAAGDSVLATRLVDALEPRFPLDGHALCTARAQLAEHAGEHVDAAALYAEAAARWQEFGYVPERASRPPRPGPLPARPQPAWSRAAAPRGSGALRSHGVQTGARRDRSAARADGGCVDVVEHIGEVTIGRRYRGPLTSGNGGYSAGRLAAFVDAPAVEVTLRLPPPLERPLQVDPRRRAHAPAGR